MPKAKQPHENVSKHVRKAVEGPDAKVKVTIYSPDHEAKEFWATIPNIKGCSTWNLRSPETIMGRIIGGLRSHYGDKVK
jgi:hypothetical protein